MALSPRIGAALAAVAGLAVVVPAWVVSHPPALPAPVLKRLAKVLPPRRVVPQAELPAVEPVDFVALAPDDARTFNASVPFSTLPNPAAQPFRYIGSPEDRARATDCLAAGVLYEAGDDAVGERAVAQVILNRLRHPAFPKTVCGVVFEGSERTTGCQFTFTCDGALTRWAPSDAGWKRAREIAAMALSGAVYRPVGYSTHYHTNWVVPYWQSSLDKVAGVGDHLFFRWSGWWGTPPAFGRHQLAGEPALAKLAAISEAHRSAAALAEANAALGEAAALGAGSVPVAAGAAADGLPRPTAADADQFLVALLPHVPADTYRTLALQTCGERERCIFMGWIDPRLTPTAKPLTDEQIAAMAFSYLRERSVGFERTLWNCDINPRSEPRQCMKRSPGRRSAPSVVPAPTPTSSPTPEPLPGVRRRPEGVQPATVPTPVATATPTARRPAS